MMMVMMILGLMCILLNSIVEFYREFTFTKKQKSFISNVAL